MAEVTRTYNIGAMQVGLVLAGMFASVLVTAASTSYFMGQEVQQIIANSRSISALQIDSKDLRKDLSTVSTNAYITQIQVDWLQGYHEQGGKPTIKATQRTR